MKESPLVTAIDVGTHATRALCARIAPGGRIDWIEDLRVPTALGRGLGRFGMIPPDAVERQTAAIKRILSLPRLRRSQAISMTGTSAFRVAANGTVVAREIERRVRLPFHILTGRQEAEIAFEGAAASLKPVSARFVVCDIGGGSTELAGGTTAGCDEVHSLEFGAVNLTEAHVRNDPVDASEQHAIATAVRQRLDDCRENFSEGFPELIGSGGTFSTLVAVYQAYHRRSPDLNGVRLSRSALAFTARTLLRKTTDELRATPGVPHDRAQYVVAGAIAALHVMDVLGSTVLILSERGLREGLVRRLADPWLPPTTP